MRGRVHLFIHGSVRDVSETLESKQNDTKKYGLWLLTVFFSPGNIVRLIKAKGEGCRDDAL